jgi:hypothetical protein
MNPLEVTNYRRTDAELERFWLYGILVAGKGADWVSEVMDRLLADCDEPPIQWLDAMSSPLLHAHLMRHRIGQYTRIVRAIRESGNINLRTASIKELESVYGIGPKTARFFALHSREDCEPCAALDRQILKWLRSLGEEVPSETPSYLPRYHRLEQVCIELQKRHFSELTLAQSDLFVWAKMSGREEEWRKRYGTHSACSLRHDSACCTGL